ncbi:aspartyl protease family protein [Pararcticibacter amylolyticus]|uniref:Clan AA aspartic protease n=1 Tax=Pararcticibacter amylolyticus TaxID=2173175 RepID=A0A2U2PCF1_9SPHI|nr:aspartyl protease family protein [Pararcticibacter amylolyticus]PWG79088.1 clan AA aspartic protease [Pararcticibacter amylolyticus]
MIEISLEILNLHDDGFHPLVEVVVFNKLFKAVVDTGASRTVFDKNTIETFTDAGKLLLTDKLSTGLGTNTMESYTLLIPELAIGDLLIDDFEVAVLDLSSINTAYEKLEFTPVIGVIGGDILMKYSAIINYADQKLSFCL